MMGTHPCSICGGYGHWHRERPQAAGAGVTEAAGAENLVCSMAPSEAYTGSKTAMVTTAARDKHADAAQVHKSVCFSWMVESVPRPVPFVPIMVVSSSECLLVLDTGCQRTCASNEWRDDRAQHVRQAGYKTIDIDFNETFKFGDGKLRPSARRMITPASIQGPIQCLGLLTLWVRSVSLRTW